MDTTFPLKDTKCNNVASIIFFLVVYELSVVDIISLHRRDRFRVNQDHIMLTREFHKFSPGEKCMNDRRCLVNSSIHHLKLFETYF